MGQVCDLAGFKEIDSIVGRNAILANADARLGAIDGVEAMYLSDSLAEEAADQFSDIDLRLVVADAAYESVVALRENLPGTWGPFLFHGIVNQSLTVSSYESWRCRRKLIDFLPRHLRLHLRPPFDLIIRSASSSTNI